MTSFFYVMFRYAIGGVTTIPEVATYAKHTIEAHVRFSEVSGGFGVHAGSLWTSMWNLDVSYSAMLVSVNFR